MVRRQKWQAQYVDALEPAELDLSVYDPRKALAITGGCIVGGALLAGLPYFLIVPSGVEELNDIRTGIAVLVGGAAAVGVGLLIGGLAYPGPEVDP
ncbi:MAG: hypothetical protein IV100_09590 [Myxococcales bacterium]|nr:hypothetical protein [Myxococcales bacterium]